MKSRGILVSYSGRITTPSSLMLDNGLATLAGCLLEQGHEVKVVDMSTVDLIERLKLPSEMQEEVRSIGASISEQMKAGKNPDADLVKKLKEIEAEADGHHNEIVDRIAEEISMIEGGAGADWVGLKLWNGDGFTGSIRIAEAVKHMEPGIKVFAGGPHADWFMEHIMRKTDAFDALAYADGERTIVNLAEHSKGKMRLSEIPGIIFRDNGNIVRNDVEWIDSLDKVPMQVYDTSVYPAAGGNNKIRVMVIDESRGCPYVCNFCIQPVKSGSRWRKKNAARVADEMQMAREVYGISAFRYAGSSTPPQHAVEIAREIKRRGLKVSYSAFASAKGFRPDDFETLRESGCISMFFGLESGSPKILRDSIGKKASLAEFEEAIAGAKNAGIYTIASIVVPAPFETEQTMEDTYQFLMRVRPDSVPMSPPGLMRDTPWGNEPEKFGFRIRNPEVFPADFMDYKINLLFPGILWDVAPYDVNGMDSRQFLGAMSRFMARVEQGGILTAVPDDMYVAARFAGMDPRQYRDETRRALLTGDYETMSSIVKTTNANIKRGDLNAVRGEDSTEP